jgi:hypothetical protein
MPYSTSQNGGLTAAANALTKIFVGDPAADAAYRKAALEEETEYQRQRLLAEQVISEGVQRKAQEAAAAANYAQADKYKNETERLKEKNKAFTNMGNIFTGMPQAAATMAFTDPSVEAARARAISDPNFLPTLAAAAPIQEATAAVAPQYMGKAIDQAMPDILSNLFMGEMEPKMLTAAAALPGVSDEQIARMRAGAGLTLGQQEYVSLGDRNENRRFDVGAGSRLVGGDGSEIVPLAPAFVQNLESQGDLRDAQAGYYETRSAGGGGKVPKLGNDEINASLSNLAKSIGIKPIVVPGQKGSSYAAALYQSIGQNPQIAQDLQNITSDVWRQTGGDSAAVNQALMLYMRSITQNGQPMSNYKNISSDVGLPTLEEILSQVGVGAPAPDDLGSTFTGGSEGTSEMDGQTATNPQTGEKVIFKNGRWEPM